MCIPTCLFTCEWSLTADVPQHMIRFSWATTIYSWTCSVFFSIKTRNRNAWSGSVAQLDDTFEGLQFKPHSNIWPLSAAWTPTTSSNQTRRTNIQPLSAVQTLSSSNKKEWLTNMMMVSKLSLAIKTCGKRQNTVATKNWDTNNVSNDAIGKIYAMLYRQKLESPWVRVVAEKTFNYCWEIWDEGA